ncbi:MAG: phosphomethylpyrimidine synthase ThiC [Bacillota bacterium]
MTQLQEAKKGIITPEMAGVAAREGLSPDFIRAGLAAGTIVIPANRNHHTLKPHGIGKGLKTKVNANIGTSTQFPDIGRELVKLRTALSAGTDAVMDLSTGGDLDALRRQTISECPVPVGTVPIYQAAVEAQKRNNSIVELDPQQLFDVIYRQAMDGVDFITVHCGVTLHSVRRLQSQGRVTDIVSRGGSFITGWMLHNNLENPLYTDFERLLDICLEFDVTLSLGDGLRPGCLADATDRAQVEELIILGELVDRARERGVQVMVEGPGHVPLNQIAANIVLQKSLCREAPFYVLGPLVTDVAPGYDHITSAIGGALAAMAGADFLCYVTPAEHLGLPTAEDVKEGVIATRIAGHAADIVKGVPGAWEWDLAMSRARKNLDWDGQLSLAIDPEKARLLRKERNPVDIKECTMCGEFCAMRLVADFLGVKKTGC